jgi:hypothetical protein
MGAHEAAKGEGLSDRPKCDACPALAVTGVRDIRDARQPGEKWERWMPTGPPRWGCADHPPEPSKEILG